MNDSREVKWGIQRMQKIVKTWEKLDDIDKMYLLDRFVDEMVIAKLRRAGRLRNDR